MRGTEPSLTIACLMYSRSGQFLPFTLTVMSAML